MERGHGDGWSVLRWWVGITVGCRERCVNESDEFRELFHRNVSMQVGSDVVQLGSSPVVDVGVY